MYLEFIKDLPVSSMFKITSDDNETGQIIIFHHDDYSIEFIEPLWSNYGYLDNNRKWLRSILFTALRIKNKENFKIPFTFPKARREKIDPENVINVYSDGSCSVKGIGGWAAVILKPDGEQIELSGSERNSTSNRMELMGAFKAIEKAAELIPDCGKKGICLFSDSLYVIKGISHRLEVWSTNRFITAMGTPVVNIDIWRKIAEILKDTDVFCQWVESYGSDVHHNRCDILAGEQSRKLINSPENNLP